MGYKIIQPSPKLSTFIDNFWILNVSENELPFVHTILPFAWFELFFDLNSSSNPTAKYVGQLSSGFDVIHRKPYRSVGIRLKPNVANLLFNIPTNELTNCSINWSDLEPKSSLHNELLSAKSEEELIQLIETYLFKRINDYVFDDLIAYITSSITHQPELGIDNSLLSSINLSRRRIEQRFISSTGVSMGLFLRKVRFDNAIECLCLDNTQNLTHIGLKLGYYDQAHFSREFKGFAGITPKAYRKKIKVMSDLERSTQLL